LPHCHRVVGRGHRPDLGGLRWPEVRALARGSLDDPNSVTIASHIWTDSAQTGVVLPAATDCFAGARSSLDGTPLPATRHDVPWMVRAAKG
jgi:hypothetical protein